MCNEKFAPAATVSGISIPEGWFVHEAGQDFAHMLWYVILMNFDDLTTGVHPPRAAAGVEQNTFEEALQLAVDRLNSMTFDVLLEIVE